MKRRATLAATLGVVACGILGLTDFAQAGKIDAVSGSSIKVTGGTTTSSAATINYTFGETNGTRKLFYDVIDHSTVSGFTKFASTTGNSFSISGLTGGTKYYYWILITDGKHKDGSLHTDGTGKIITTFSTDVIAGILGPRSGSVANQSSIFDPLGRHSQHRGPVQINQFGTQIELNEGHR